MRTCCAFLILTAIFAASARADQDRTVSSDLSLSSDALFVEPARPEEGGVPEKISSRRLFVVDSSENDPTESLNRIAGDADPGFLFTSSDFAFESEDQTKSGPFARKNIQDYNRKEYP